MKKLKKEVYKVKNIIVIGAVLLIVLILLFGVPFVINELYMKNEGYITLWGAGDVLLFYGNVLSFIGTCALGLLSLYQNKVFKDANEKMQKMQENNYQNEKRPVYQFKYTFSKINNTISLYPKKVFDSVGYNERIIECTLLDNDLNIRLSVDDWNDSAEFKFNISKEIKYETKDFHYIRLTLGYTDIFNCTVHDTYWLIVTNKGECSTFLENRVVMEAKSYKG